MEQCVEWPARWLSSNNCILRDGQSHKGGICHPRQPQTPRSVPSAPLSPSTDLLGLQGVRWSDPSLLPLPIPFMLTTREAALLCLLSRALPSPQPGRCPHQSQFPQSSVSWGLALLTFVVWLQYLPQPRAGSGWQAQGQAEARLGSVSVGHGLAGTWGGPSSLEPRRRTAAGW